MKRALPLAARSTRVIDTMKQNIGVIGQKNTKRLQDHGKFHGFSNLKEEPDGWTNSVIKRVLDVYHARGVLQADDALNAVLKSDFPCFHRSLKDLQHIFHFEMTATKIDHQSDVSETNETEQADTAHDIFHAIACWSRAIQYVQTNDSKAQKFSKKFIEFVQGQEYLSGLSPKLPQKWIDEAAEICAAVNNEKVPQLSRQILISPRKWDEVSNDSDTPAVVKDLLSMVGMENIKEEFYNIYQRHQLAEKQDKRTFCLNARLEGKPGTGKRTVAHHYAALLRHLKILPKNSILFQVSGASLSSGGIEELKTTLSDLKKANGGAILIQDAYCLTEDNRGKQVLHYMLSLANDKTTSYGNLVWILAGNKQEMQKMVDLAPSLIHCFPNRFVFRDFTNDELMQIFKQLLTLPPPEKKTERVNNGNFEQMIDYKGEKWHLRDDGRWYDEVGSSMTSKPLKSVAEKSITMQTPDKLKWILKVRGNEWICDEGTRLTEYPPTADDEKVACVKEAKTSEQEQQKLSEQTKEQCTVTLDGVKWFQDGKLWRDAYGSYCLHHPSEGFVEGKPLFTKDGKKWIQQRRLEWENVISGDISLNPSADWAKRNERPESFRCEEIKYARMAIDRLGKRRSGVTFGNAYSVQAYYAAVRARQAARVCAEADQGKSADMYQLTRYDLLGPQVTSEGIRHGVTYRKLQALEGLLPVKKAVDELIELIAVNAKREEAGEPLLGVVLNRVFLGNPGTGKTTVAHLYGQLLAEMGLLSKGEVVLKTASDFIGNVLGSSESITKKILNAAEGCVLVIDEAYGLYSGNSNMAGNNQYSAAVINAIVEQVQAEPGEDRAVILLGYRTEMENMLRNSNPGLARRFQLENAFEFPDYSDVELLRILFSKAKACSLSIDIEVAKRAVALLAKERAKPNFGNAGAVENLLSEAKTKLAVGESKLTLKSFGIPDNEDGDLHLDSVFNDMVGCDSLNRFLSELRNTVAFAHSRGEDPRDHIDYNFLFLGNPGTGKTTVARRMGGIFYTLGLLPDDRVTEISASDLVTGYAGQAGKQTREMLNSSRGGVLIIDEAYQLDPKRGGSYMTEVVDELVRCTTIESFKKSTLVILAGYTDPMADMLKVNKGLESRFPEKIEFQDLDSYATMKLLVQKLQEKHLELEDGLEEEVRRLASKLATSKNFANGRDVARWSNAVFREFSMSQIDVDDPAKRNLGHLFDAKKKAKVTLQHIRSALDRIGDFCRPERRNSIDQSGIVEPDSQQQYTALQEALMKSIAQVTETEIIADQKMDLAGQQFKVDEPEKQNSEKLHIPQNGFDNLDPKFLQSLQQYLEEIKLNSEAGVELIVKSKQGEKVFDQLVDRLKESGFSEDIVQRSIQSWKEGQQDLKSKLHEVEMHKKQGRRPIWRCAVCGRDDKPWITCWVAPYIVAYESL